MMFIDLLFSINRLLSARACWGQKKDRRCDIWWWTDCCQWKMSNRSSERVCLSNNLWKQDLTKRKKKRVPKNWEHSPYGSPYGIRTRATGVRGRRPRPLDERATTYCFSDGWKLSLHITNVNGASRLVCARKLFYLIRNRNFTIKTL